MTDWELITSQIERALTALDQAQQAGQTLRQQTTVENLDLFQQQMHSLTEHLEHFRYIMEHQDEVFADDLADALSDLWSGQPSAYHLTPHDERSK